MKLAIVGVTGLVGTAFLKVLEERNFPVTTLIPVASEASKGKKINFKGKEYDAVTNDEALELKPEIALFSAGSGVSKAWAEKYAEIGCKVIDNSSAWRMDDSKKLVIPEVNGEVLEKEDFIIANPNCSTIQMLVPLVQLHRNFQIKRIVVSTYQSITGTGVKAVRQMENERNNVEGEMAYPHVIDKNCLPHCDVFNDNGYTTEELKLVRETKKILDPNIKVTATAVRVPVVGGHSESVNVEFEKDVKLNQIINVLNNSAGVEVMDIPEQNIYPMPVNAKDKDEVFVGRIREDFTQKNTYNLWIVADNLRKGAATNAIQIAEYLMDKSLI
jgi:aspartate-semialdehyde dehydrogenase